MMKATDLWKGHNVPLPYQNWTKNWSIFRQREMRPSEVDVVAWAFCQPGFDQRRFVGGIVVHDYMDIEIVRNTAIDLLQEVEELGGSMAFIALADDKPGSDVECCEK